MKLLNLLTMKRIYYEKKNHEKSNFEMMNMKKVTMKQGFPVTEAKKP